MEVGVPEAAEHLQVSGRRLRQLLASGQVRGRRVGGQWMIDESELARKPRVSRPLSIRMTLAFIDYAGGGRGNPMKLSPNERQRVREMLGRLRESDDPSALLRSWLGRRAQRREYFLPASDVEDLKHDPRLVLSGISDPRAGMSAGGEVEGYVKLTDQTGLTRDFLLVQSLRPNVFLHICLPDYPVAHPVPLIVVAADLSDFQGAREDGQVERLVRELP